MNLYTKVEQFQMPAINHQQRLMLIGSCFATEMGAKLQEACFQVDVNPYGVLYNPLSISMALKEMLSKKEYEEVDLVRYNDWWHSPMHHGDFSAIAADEVLQKINDRIVRANDELKSLDWLLMTWGSSWVYEEVKTRRIVGNCHKMPERNFTRRRLSVEEIVTDYISLLTGMFARNPQLKVLFTVSPIRHVRDGLHANQLSKATLLLAIEVLQQHFPDRVFYFPAYELLLDELRDYRFFADDLVHPSRVAVEMVWERLMQTTMEKETLEVIKQCNEVKKAVAHRPLHPESEEYYRFLEQILLKISLLQEKYPYLVLEKEIQLCRTRLKK